MSIVNVSNINSSYTNGDNDEDDIQSMTSSQLNFKERYDDDCVKEPDNMKNTDLLQHAYYVTTGAMIPNTCNAVIPVEYVKVEHTTPRTSRIDVNESNISSPNILLQILPSAMSALPKNNWIRQLGSDIAPDTLLVPSQTVLDPISIGLLYQSGKDIGTCTT